MEIPVNDASKLPEDEAARLQAELIQGTPPESEMPGQTDLASPAEVSDSLGDSGSLPEVTPVSAESETPEVGSSTDKSEMVAPPEDTSIASEQADSPLLERSAMEAPAEDVPHPTEEIDNTNRGNFERFIPEGPETTEVPVVNVGNALDTPEADREQSSEQTEEAPAEDTRIEDRDEAEEYARAAKPFDDAKVEKADKLDEEQQETLSWLSSEAGEEAARTYRESKKQMTEAEAAIKEKIAPLKRLANGPSIEYEAKSAKFNKPSATQEEREELFTNADTLLAKVVNSQLDEILEDDSLSDREKLDKANQLYNIRYCVRRLLGVDNGGGGNFPENADDLVRHWGRSGHTKETLVPLLWGQFIAGMVQDREVNSIMALEKISELTNRPFEEIFDSVKESFVAATNEQGRQFSNRHLERHGYIWRESTGQYVKFES